MGLLGADPPLSDVARVALERDRVCDRLRSMSLVRLAAPLADGRTRAQAAHAAAQALADLAADISDQHRRSVPRLADHAVGDQVAVMVNDLLAVLESEASLSPAQVARSCEDAAVTLVGLRLVL